MYFTYILFFNFTENILDEEQAERQIAKMEQQLSKTERKLLGDKSEHRDWFQTKKQREDEKQRLSLNPEESKTKKSNDKGKKRKHPEYGGDGEDGPPVKELNAKKKKKEEAKTVKTPEQLAKERAMKEIEKVSLVRAKISKLHKRPGKLSAVTDGPIYKKGGGSAKPKRLGNSAFTNDLTDVSRSGALRLRSEANRHQKMSKIAAKKKTSNVKLTNKAGTNKFNKGKSFGGQRFSKKDKNKKK